MYYKYKKVYHHVEFDSSSPYPSATLNCLTQVSWVQSSSGASILSNSKMSKSAGSKSFGKKTETDRPWKNLSLERGKKIGRKNMEKCIR